MLARVISAKTGDISKKVKSLETTTGDEVKLDHFHAFVQAGEVESRGRCAGCDRIFEGQLPEVLFVFPDFTSSPVGANASAASDAGKSSGPVPGQQPVGCVVVILDLDPDRLYALVGKGRTVDSL